MLCKILNFYPFIIIQTYYILKVSNVYFYYITYDYIKIISLLF